MQLRSTVLATLLALCAGLGAPALRAETRPFQSFDIGRGLAGDRVYDLAIDSGGQLWIATLTGISRFDGREFENFDMRHGLPFAVVPRLLVTRDGRIYAGTNRGLARLDPRAAVSARPFRKLATDADKDGGRLALLVEATDGTIRPSAAGGLLAATSSALVEVTPAGARIVYRPEPGQPFEVTVAAQSADGTLWSGFYQGGMARRSAGKFERMFGDDLRPRGTVSGLELDRSGRLWVASAGSGLMRIDDPLAAADLHDDLGSSLSRISILSEVARRQSDAAQDPGAALEEIGASARSLAEMAGDIVWAIDPQKDDLASLVVRLRRFGSDLFEPLGTRFAIEAPDDTDSIHLAAAARRDLYLLLKEALNNAAKYARASSVALRFARAGGRLDVELVDDGVGFDPGTPARGGGHGLGSLRERAAEGGEVALTEQERRLLSLLSDGHSYKSAADELEISVNTVRNHIRSLYEKLQVHTRSEAVGKALRGGVI